MLPPLSMLSQISEVVQWCSLYCKGNPATHAVSFVMNDEEFHLSICDECLEEFLDNGPPKGNNDPD